jgi:hypothetical protein
MRSKWCACSAAADVVKKLDRRKYEETKNLSLLYAEGKPERPARIEGAKTLTEIQKVFIELVDETDAA